MGYLGLVWVWGLDFEYSVLNFVEVECLQTYNTAGAPSTRPQRAQNPLNQILKHQILNPTPFVEPDPAPSTLVTSDT